MQMYIKVLTYTQTNKNLVKKPHVTPLCSVLCAGYLQKNHNFLIFEGLNFKNIQYEESMWFRRAQR